MGGLLDSEAGVYHENLCRQYWRESGLAFRAEDDDQARAIIETHEGSMRSDLKVLVGTDGKPLWDGKSAIEAREATAAQHAEWEQSRDQAISDGEIDLDAGNDPDEWNVYLISIPQTKNLQRND
jgi:hypothetical protein